MECMCKQYHRNMSMMDTFFSVVNERKETVCCPICDDAIKFTLPKHIPKIQADLYADEIIQRLKDGKVR